MVRHDCPTGFKRVRRTGDKGSTCLAIAPGGAKTVVEGAAACATMAPGALLATIDDAAVDVAAATLCRNAPTGTAGQGCWLGATDRTCAVEEDAWYEGSMIAGGEGRGDSLQVRISSAISSVISSARLLCASPPRVAIRCGDAPLTVRALSC